MTSVRNLRRVLLVTALALLIGSALPASPISAATKTTTKATRAKAPKAAKSAKAKTAKPKTYPPACTLLTKADLVAAGATAELSEGENNPDGVVGVGSSACAMPFNVPTMSGYIALSYEINPKQGSLDEFFADTTTPVAGLPKGNLVFSKAGESVGFTVRRDSVVATLATKPEVMSPEIAASLAKVVYARLA
jgi:hypothetical protein